MFKIRPLRRAAALLVTCLLPFAISCLQEKRGDSPLPEKRADSPKETESPPNVVEAPRSNKAIDEATEAISRDPNGVNDRSESAYALRGRAYADQGEYDKAIADYTDAIRVYQSVKPRYVQARLVEVYQLRAECHQKKREYDKAIADYGEVIQLGTGGFLDPGEAMVFGGFAAGAHYKRGICYDETGDHAKAMADYKEAVRLGPDLANNEDLKQRMGK